MPSTSWASYAVKNFSAIGRNFAVFVFISVLFGIAFVVVFVA
jgi:hypothetical protein